MKGTVDPAETPPELSRWRVVLGYVKGMVVEISAVAAVSSAALLVMLLVKVIVK